MSKKADKRRTKINELILTNGSMRVDDLAQSFHVTKETIRGDLRYLEGQGQIQRGHGSAQKKDQISEIPIEYRQIQNNEVKRKMARAAIDLIHNDSLLYMDSSTSVLEVGRLLLLKKKLTIFTNSLILAMSLKNTTHRICLLGGDYFADGQRTIGSRTVEAVKDIYFDQCLLGTDGMCGNDGVGTGSSEEQQLLKTVVEHSKEKILIADASKLKKSAPYQYARQDVFDVLVTTEKETAVLNDLQFRKIVSV